MKCSECGRDLSRFRYHAIVGGALVCPECYQRRRLLEK